MLVLPATVCVVAFVATGAMLVAVALEALGRVYSPTVILITDMLRHKAHIAYGLYTPPDAKA